MSHDVMRLVGRRERSASCSVVAAAPHARSASPDPNFPPSTGLAAAEMDGMILLICQSIVKKQPSACGYSWRISTKLLHSKLVLDSSSRAARVASLHRTPRAQPSKGWERARQREALLNVTGQLPLYVFQHLPCEDPSLPTNPSGLVSVGAHFRW